MVEEGGVAFAGLGVLRGLGVQLLADEDCGAPAVRPAGQELDRCHFSAGFRREGALPFGAGQELGRESFGLFPEGAVCLLGQVGGVLASDLDGTASGDGVGAAGDEQLRAGGGPG